MALSVNDAVRAEDDLPLDDWVASVLSPWVQSFEGWESEGHLPAAFFAGLGAAGLFRRRWEHGAQAGLPVALAYARYVSPYNMGVALALSVHTEVFTHAVAEFGRTEQHREVFEAAIDGRAIGCVALTEHGGGSDLTNVRTTARREGGGWRLTGEKRFISNAGTATHAVVLAQAERRSGSLPTLFLVETDTDGFDVAGFYPKLGTKAADTCRIVLDCHLPADSVLGPLGAGLACAVRCLRYERILVSAGVLSAARYSLDLAVAFLRSRVTFDTRLFSMQALRHKAAAAAVRLRSAEALLAQTAAKMMDGTARDDDVAAAKYHCVRTAGEVLDDAMQLLGGRGYTSCFPVERMWRDARLARIGGGTDELMLEIISGALDMPDPRAEAELQRYLDRDGEI